MPPVFSAQAAGSIPHCVADHDHIANVSKMVGRYFDSPGRRIPIGLSPLQTTTDGWAYQILKELAVVRSASGVAVLL